MQISNLIQSHTYIGLLIVLFFATTAILVNKPNADLEQRVSDLENRVTLLEESITGTDTIDASERRPQYRANRENWRQLRERMREDKVQELLGEPQRVTNYGSSVTWHYPIQGMVHFSRGRVSSWSEPLAF